MAHHILDVMAELMAADPGLSSEDANALGWAQIIQERGGGTDGLTSEQQELLGIARVTLPWLPEALLETYVQKWTEFGDPEVALLATRADPTYAAHFPGIKRDDGTLRMTELEYMGAVVAYEDALIGVGVNPNIMAHRFGDLIEGEVSADEFRSRIAAVHERVLLQEDAIRSVYADFHGLALTTEGIVASMLDPDINSQIVNRQITMAEVGGEAALAGFQINRSRATSIVQAGFGQAKAQELFQQAAQVVGNLGRGAARQAEGQFGIDQFIESQALGNVREQRKIQRVLAGEQSDFSERGLFEVEDGTVKGLGRR